MSPDVLASPCRHTRSIAFEEIIMTASLLEGFLDRPDAKVVSEDAVDVVARLKEVSVDGAIVRRSTNPA
jgi:hypothetical protein